MGTSMIQLTILGALLALLTTLPLAWKWQLDVRRTAMSVAALAIVFGPLVSYVGRGMGLSILLEAASVWFLILITALATLGYCFFRDPEREPPEGEDVLVSPADGT